MVFSDLDGTLLDHRNYSFEPALPALSLLEERKIPLIICTSKTRAEIEPIRRTLRNDHPFISENGGGVFIPQGYFEAPLKASKQDSSYVIIELGTPYPRLREALKKIQALFPGKIEGFGDLSTERIADLCGFTLEEARWAREREYDEPFMLEDKRLEPEIVKKAETLGLHITRGGRFYHLLGNNDKGKAVSLLTGLFQQEEENDVITFGAGDSLNDLPLLETVDCPVLVQKPDGSFDPKVRLPNLDYAPAPGPSGWNEAIINLIKRSQNCR